MTEPLRQIGRELLVWLIALIAVLAIIGQFVIALYHALIFDAVVWSLVGLSMFFLASQIEKIKLFLESSGA